MNMSSKTRAWVFGCCLAVAIAVAGSLLLLNASPKAHASTTPDPAANIITVGVASASLKPLARELTVSSELVPFQEIDVYAKESGYVRELNVDYGSRVKAGQVMAVLEIPELRLQLAQDDAAIKSAADQVRHAEHALNRVEAQHQVLHLQYDRLHGVAQEQPGLVAQQEVDDSQGKDLAAEAQVEEAKSTLESARSMLEEAQAKRQRDGVLFDYSKITAPFDGVVTQRYANLGALMQAGTTSTQATPLVRLSEERLYRLVIPVPESYVPYVHIGDPVEVRVPALNRTFTGKVTRFSVDVNGDTRTMHTEVDIPNPNHQLVPGAYAEAVLTLNQNGNVLAIPLQAINRNGTETGVYVVDPDGRVEDRPIALGAETANYAEVTSGLKNGELVVISDRSSLKPGEVVKPQQASAMEWQGKGKDQGDQ
jgi:RND family efflux transporter MFP subunit